MDHPRQGDRSPEIDKFNKKLDEAAASVIRGQEEALYSELTKEDEPEFPDDESNYFIQGETRKKLIEIQQMLYDRRTMEQFENATGHTLKGGYINLEDSLKPEDMQKTLDNTAEATKNLPRVTRSVQGDEFDAAREKARYNQSGTYHEKRTDYGGRQQTWRIIVDDNGDIINEELIDLGSKPLKKEKQRTMFDDMQPQLSGVYPNVDIMQAQPMGSNPCGEVMLPGFGDGNPPLDPEVELSPEDLAMAHRIEDCIEDYIGDNYQEGAQYDITLPCAASNKVYEFINARMYKWTIQIVDDKTWKVW